MHEELKDTKEVIRIRKSKDRQQWPKETGQKNKQRSTKHTHKTRDKIRIPPADKDTNMDRV
jgi:hypothetical protein